MRVDLTCRQSHLQTRMLTVTRHLLCIRYHACGSADKKTHCMHLMIHFPAKCWLEPFDRQQLTYTTANEPSVDVAGTVSWLLSSLYMGRYACIGDRSY